MMGRSIGFYLMIALMALTGLVHTLAINSEENALFNLERDECRMMVCRAGRECTVGADGEATCACVASCPDHFVPVCGSNNQSYDNYCLMHRDACLTGLHISLKKKGYCSNKSIKKKKKTSKKKEESSSVFEPVVCFQWERDALRRQIMAHFRHHHAGEQDWYLPGLKGAEKLWARFYSCDTSKDEYVDANELANCVADVPFHLRTSDANNELVKVLCVDAIIDSGDKNSDWRLDFDEYKDLMDSSFQPKEKLCSLEGKKYEDGAKTKVDCNDCVCACGSWVCSSKKCDQKLNEIDELDDGEDEDLEDELEDVGTSKKDDQIKILEIEEDTDLKIDDPDEDQPPIKSKLDEDEEDDYDEDDDDDEDDDEEEDEKPSKKKKKSP